MQTSKSPKKPQPLEMVKNGDENRNIFNESPRKEKISSAIKVNNPSFIGNSLPQKVEDQCSNKNKGALNLSLFLTTKKGIENTGKNKNPKISEVSKNENTENEKIDFSNFPILLQNVIPKSNSHKRKIPLPKKVEIKEYDEKLKLSDILNPLFILNDQEEGIEMEENITEETQKNTNFYPVISKKNKKNNKRNISFYKKRNIKINKIANRQNNSNQKNEENKCLNAIEAGEGKEVINPPRKYFNRIKDSLYKLSINKIRQKVKIYNEKYEKKKLKKIKERKDKTTNKLEEANTILEKKTPGLIFIIYCFVLFLVYLNLTFFATFNK